MEPNGYAKWLSIQHMRKAELIAASPSRFGLVPDPKWVQKHELLISYELSPDVARYLSALSADIGQCVRQTMTFEPAELHSTIAVLRIPPELEHDISYDELAEHVGAAVIEAISRSVRRPLITSYDRLIPSSNAVVAWPASTGVLYPLRTLILDQVEIGLRAIPQICQVNVTGSWGEHVTVARPMAPFKASSPEVAALEACVADWSATYRFAMAAVNVSELTVENGRMRLDSKTRVGLAC